MARIKEYGLDSDINAADKVVGTDGTPGDDFGKTKNFSIGSLKDFIAGSQLVTTKVTVTSAQLLSLNGGGSIELIAAPGENKVIIPMSICGFLDFNTTAYVSSSDSVIKFRSGTTGTFGNISKSTIERPNDVYFAEYPDDSEVEAGVNAALYLTADETFDLTTGDSPLILSIAYRIADFS